MHSVGKNSLIYAQLSTLAWAACGTLTVIIFFSARKRAVSSESCILIGSGSGQNFAISETVMVTARKPLNES